MPLFDRIVIVDWSANNTPKRGKDSIWIGDIAVDGDCGWRDVTTHNCATRAEAVSALEVMIGCALQEGERLLVGFDFAFGYPRGAAEAMSGIGEWDAVWAMLADRIKDGVTNSSNRFEVASGLNVAAFGSEEGPFWGHPHQHHGRYDHLTARRPAYNRVPERRLVEQRVPSAQPVWKLAYTGSVGSQSLLGIARLQGLRERFGDQVAVWPFETQFLDALSGPVTLAEIYPSIAEIPDDVAGVASCTDEAQVIALASAFANLDGRDELATLLAEPDGLSDAERTQVVSEEGWIIGANEPDLLRRVPQMLVSPSAYIRDPAEIYRQSFATVEAEAGLDALPAAMRPVAMRLIHSCGMVDVLDDIAFSKGAAEAGATALHNGAAVFCDVEMVRSGIIQRLLPAQNETLCTLNDGEVSDHAKTIENTRCAAAVDFWDARLEGAVVAVGNAPTALFRLLERLADGSPRPALIVGIPVGFVGAVESKQALAAFGSDLNYITVHGRRGGSAMASAVVNALAGGLG